MLTSVNACHYKRTFPQVVFHFLVNLKTNYTHRQNCKGFIKGVLHNIPQGKNQNELSNACIVLLLISNTLPEKHTLKTNSSAQLP